MIGVRTREALAARRANGVHLGRPSRLALEMRELIVRLRNEERKSLSGIAATLNESGLHTATGARWSEVTVRSALRRLPVEMIDPAS